MPAILRAVAFVFFVVAAVIAVVVDAPDAIDILAAISVGLALWVLSTLVPAT